MHVAIAPQIAMSHRAPAATPLTLPACGERVRVRGRKEEVRSPQHGGALTPMFA
jgi:hypothetical protein